MLTNTFSRVTAFLIASVCCLPAFAQGVEIDKALGTYVTVLVDNFEGTTFAQGATRNMVCVAKASEIVKNFEREGGSAVAIFQQPAFALYKVVTKNKQNMLVQCNQNGSLVVAWRSDAEMQDFVNAASTIGISLNEAQIHAQEGQSSAPVQPVVINNGQSQ